MTETSVNASSFIVGGTSGTVTCNGAEATFIPQYPLIFGERYTVTITTAVADRAGNPMRTQFSSEFITLVPETTLVASAGEDIDVNGGEAVSLDGTGSYDPDQQPFSYEWKQVHGPEVALIGAATANPQFTAPDMVATLEFELMVTNGTEAGWDRVVVSVFEDKTKTVFISIDHGHDSNAGTRAAPLKTIAAGLAKASPTGSDLYIADGTYAGRVELVSNVSLYGGFTSDDEPTWRRDLSDWRTVISGDSIGVRGVGVNNLRIDGLKIQSSPGRYPAGSSVAMSLRSCLSLTVSRSCLLAGVGGAGSDRPNRSDQPTKASNGGRGENSSVWCAQSDGGGGGSSPVHRAGGWGGNGGSTYSNSGGSGEDGGGCAGAGRDYLQELAGGNGCSGASNSGRGTDGPGGSSFGSIVGSGAYLRSDGQPGATGGAGWGGGGGGGGSGGGGTCGGAGGGGGAGGLGGYGGYGGMGGGASIGVLLTAGSAVEIAASTVIVQLGGRGGKGSLGGPGGEGGSGASGGSGYTDWAGITWAYNGGRGGAGGLGQRGGAGGGGSGGPSICLLIDASSTASVADRESWKWPAQGAQGGVGYDEAGNAGAFGLSVREWKMQ